MGVAWQRMCGPSATAASRLGQTCADIAAVTVVAKEVRCAVRLVRSMTCVLVVHDVRYVWSCDMLEYARAQMSCISVFYLSGVAGECIFNTQISRHAQPTRACKIHCMPLAVAAHVDWRATLQHNPPRGQNAGGASSFGSTIEPYELPPRNPRPMSRPELCRGDGRATSAPQRKPHGFLSSQIREK
jgi:hypothetical protein